MTDGKLYETFKSKRMSDKKSLQSEPLLDWRKLIPNENGAATSKPPAIVSLVPTRKKATPMDVVGETKPILIFYLCLIPNHFAGLPGYDRLTDEEKSICSDIRLIPIAFLEYKRLLMNENANVGYLRLSDARRLIKIDVNKTREIYNFLIKNGYVNAPFS